MPTWQAVLVGVIPSIFVVLLFWYVMRAVIRADRNERRELARIDREDAQRAAPQATTQAAGQAATQAAADDPAAAQGTPPKEPRSE